MLQDSLPVNMSDVRVGSSAAIHDSTISTTTIGSRADAAMSHQATQAIESSISPLSDIYSPGS